MIEARCKEVGATLHKADFADIHLLSHDLTGQVFDWERFHALKLPLLGDHQLHNAAVAHRGDRHAAARLAPYGRAHP